MEKTRLPLSHHFRTAAAVAAVVLFLPLLLSACGKSGASAQNAALSEANKIVMGHYENIRAALAADDLRGSQRAATKLITILKPVTADSAPAANAPASPMLEPAEAIVNAQALDRARAAFKIMSVEAMHLTDGVKGYYVINCSMVPNGDWVQTDDKVSNPYMGKIMHDYGVVKN